MTTRFDWFAREAAKKILELSGARRVHIRIEYEHGGINFVSPEADWKEVAREAVSR